jgi:hypothetical protein
MARDKDVTPVFHVVFSSKIILYSLDFFYMYRNPLHPNSMKRILTDLWTFYNHLPSAKNCWIFASCKFSH